MIINKNLETRMWVLCISNLYSTHLNELAKLQFLIKLNKQQTKKIVLLG